MHTLKGNNKHQTDVEKGLELIYGEENLDQRGTFERRSSHRWLWAVCTVVFVGLFLGVIGWTGFVLFKPFRALTEPGLTLRIHGPTTLKFGALQTYQIQWMNQGKRSLAHARIRLVVPMDFQLQKQVPTVKDAKKMEWDLGALDPGAQGSIEVQGIFTGSLGTQSAFQAIGSYRPVSFDQDFEHVAVHAVVCADSILAGQISAPTKILSGDPVTLHYTIVNRSSEVQAGLIARFTIPSGFVVTVPATTSSRQGVSIALPPLLPNVSSSVQLVGSFT
ncbi:hypothetical protein FJZ48_03535, partial [Candidatus Uhrbacteria bacterium]|nr:hypothetical protein [Candidatus Uhrbacteria bacterium]